MLILPAIDIYGGNIVRLQQGEFRHPSIYLESPFSAARRIVASGLTAMHVVDLEGARLGRLVNWEALEEIFADPGAEVQVGGGIRSGEEIERLLALGAARVIIGSVAFSDPDRLAEWLAEFGADRVMVALDLRDGRIAVRGWQSTVDLDPDRALEALVELGVRHLVCTDISRDGMLAGPNIPLYTELVPRFPELTIQASGGIGSVADVDLLARAGVAGAIVGKAWYEERLTLAELVERSTPYASPSR